MSQPKRQLFTCPHCGCKQEFGVWESVNATLEPQLKQQLLKRELCKFTCENCAGSLWLRHPIHYHDVAAKLMLWLPQGDAQKPPVAEGSTVINLMAGSGYVFRIVKSYNELLEKIRIFDDHQDDRAVEALKLSFAKEKNLPAESMLFYDGLAEADGGKKSVRLVAVTKQGQAAYQISLDDLKKHSKRPNEPENVNWLSIDRAYAAGLSKGD